MGFMSHDNFHAVSVGACLALLRILGPGGCGRTPTQRLWSKRWPTEAASRTHQKNLLSVVCSCMLRWALRLRSRLAPEADHAK